ncbi:hypothetical protein PAMA_016119 [Pampus argenteus]
MRISLKVTICFLTASVSLLAVTGNKGGHGNISCHNMSEEQTAHVGGSVTINCNYSRAEEHNIKYFCKYENLNCRILIQMRNLNYTKLHRFTLTDNRQQRVYTLTISNLTPADAGIYMCATQSLINTTCLSEVQLHILNLDDVKAKELLCDTGDTVKVQCSYPDSHENVVKFLCKGENPLNCEALIHTTEQAKGRFSIRDNRRLKYFYVYIQNLSRADSGTYWCSSDGTWLHGGHTKIHLSVAEKRTKSNKSGLPAPQTTAALMIKDEAFEKSWEPRESSFTGVIVGVLVSVVLLVIATVVLILCRNKLRTQGGLSEQRTNAGNNTEENHGDHHYDEIQLHTQQANSGNTLPSIYATVNAPADQLHYASVNFQGVSTDRNTLPDTNITDLPCEYSSIKAQA